MRASRAAKRTAVPAAKHYCVCGRAFDDLAARDLHAKNSMCSHFLGDAPAMQRIAEALAAAEPDADKHRQQACQQLREEEARDEAIHDACLQLADLRFMKLIAGTHVDAMKAMHVRLNTRARDNLLHELHRLLQGVADQEMLLEISQLVSFQFDTYRELRTEKQELAYLKKIVPRPTYVPRLLPKGGTCYDFKIDEQLLLLMDYSKKARDMFYETLETFRTKNAFTRDDPQRILVDIPDGDVFRDHPIFGDATRVSETEAKEQAKTGPMNFALLVWGDGFIVRRAQNTPPAPLHRQSHVALALAACCMRVCACQRAR